MLERRGGKAYFYKSARVDGSPCRRYAGSGELALALAAAADGRRRIAAANKAILDHERERQRFADSELEEATASGVEMARGLLEALGFHRPCRGRWRRRRGADVADVKRAQELGASAAVPLEAGWLDDCVIARAAMILGRPDGDELATAAMRTTVLDHAKDLAGDSPSAAEWELCKSLALVWVELRQAEKSGWKHRTTPGTNHALIDLVDRRVDRLRRRYASMLKTLAELRRLATPLLVRLRAGGVDIAVAEGLQARRPAQVPGEQDR
jgi:hypothetical protein